MLDTVRKLTFMRIFQTLNVCAVRPHLKRSRSEMCKRNWKWKGGYTWYIPQYFGNVQVYWTRSLALAFTSIQGKLQKVSGLVALPFCCRSVACGPCTKHIFSTRGKYCQCFEILDFKNTCTYRQRIDLLCWRGYSKRPLLFKKVSFIAINIWNYLGKNNLFRQQLEFPYYTGFICLLCLNTLAARSKCFVVSYRSKTGIFGSNHIRDTYKCSLYFFFILVFLWRWRLSGGQISHPSKKVKVFL
jgi:hypothetical protein